MRGVVGLEDVVAGPAGQGLEAVSIGMRVPVVDFVAVGCTFVGDCRIENCYSSRGAEVVGAVGAALEDGIV